MLIKVVSFVCIIASTTLVGTYIGNMDVYRLKDLQTMKKALNMLYSEINYSISSLPIAMEQIGHKLDSVLKNIFLDVSKELRKKTGKSISEIWKDSFDKYYNKTFLQKEDYNTFSTFGRSLGFLDRETQLKNIEMLLNYINDESKYINEEKRKNIKMYRSLGILSGVLIVIILF